MSEREDPPVAGRGAERAGRSPRPPRSRGATVGLVAGIAVAIAGTVLNKAFAVDGAGRILVLLGSVVALAAVWRPEWFGRRNGPTGVR